MKTLGFAIGALLAAGLCACTTGGRTALTATAPCEEIRVPIYFLEQSDTLTAPAAEAIRLSAQQARACPVRSVAVTGLDDGGAQSDLSSRRAAAVVAAVTAAGLPAPDVSVKHGIFDRIRLSRTRTADPMREPSEVVISFN